MKDVELSHIATGIPKIDFDLGIKEALKTFEEYKIYDFLVVIKEGKPIGVVNRSELLKAQHRSSLKVGDLAHPLMKLRACVLKKEELVYLLEFFNTHRTPLFIVDKKGNYMGVLFYHVVLYYANLFKEATVPIFQKLRSCMGQPYHFYCFYIGGLKDLSSSQRESLQRILYEGVKNSIPGDVSMSYEEGEIYALSKVRVKEEDIKALYEEFHREFVLLFADTKPVYLFGYSFSLEGVYLFEDFFRLGSELKRRMVDMQDASFFIFHGEKPSVVLCEYEKREFIHQIRLKIKRDFEYIVEGLKKTDRDLWEITLYDFFKKYPYFELFYIIGENGLQVSNNVANPRLSYPVKVGKKGADRSEKEYFKRASQEDVFITNIYISQATDDFCITVSKRFAYAGKVYVLAGDINYTEVHKLVRTYASQADR